MNISDSEFVLMRRVNRLAADTSDIVSQAAANEAALRRQIASLREQLEAERGRRRHLQLQLTRATN